MECQAGVAEHRLDRRHAPWRLLARSDGGADAVQAGERPGQVVDDRRGKPRHAAGTGNRQHPGGACLGIDVGGEAVDEVPAIRQVDVVRTGGAGRQGDAIVLALEGPRAVDDQVRPGLGEARLEVGCLDIKAQGGDGLPIVEPVRARAGAATGGNRFQSGLQGQAPTDTRAEIAQAADDDDTHDSSLNEGEGGSIRGHGMNKEKMGDAVPVGTCLLACTGTASVVTADRSRPPVHSHPGR